MDFKSLLKSFDTLAEGDVVHKGDYGNKYGKEDVRDQYGHKIGKVDKGEEAKKSEPKKGRGRPKKDVGDAGTKFDSSSLSNVLGGKKPSKAVGTVSKKHSLKEYMESVEAEKTLNEADPVQIKPASQTQTQVIQQGNKTLGTVSNPQLAAQLKNAIGKGEMSLTGDEEQNMAEDTYNDEVKKAFPGGKAVGVKTGVAAPKGTSTMPKDKEKARGYRIEESITIAESPETLQHIISKYKHEVKNFINGEELDHDLYEALFDYYFNAGEIPYGTAKGRTGDPYEWITQRFDQDVHDHVVDENTIRDFTQHALSKPTNNFKTAGSEPGGSMAVPRGTPTQINRPVPEPTPWSVDPINAATDRAFNFIDSLKKKTPFTEGSDMKDIQVESWNKQLNGLLTEGLTVSSSTGQQGQPNTVTVSATEGDADSLMQVLRSAGIGGFGAEPTTPGVGYGVAQGGEEEFDGTGTEPQPAPDVVGDDGDMLSLIKKMAGLGGGNAEVVAVSGGDEEGSDDYEDEEGSEEGGEDQGQTLEPAQGGEEDSDDKEETDEGNAFTGKLAQTKQGSEFKLGDKQYKDTSSLEEEDMEEGNKFTGNLAQARAQGKEEADLDGDGDMEKVREGEDTCNECGMYESECGCDHDHVEESFANSANDPSEQELMKLKALLSMGNDMHKVKSSQTVGNPTRVQFESQINDWKKLSGIK